MNIDAVNICEYGRNCHNGLRCDDWHSPNDIKEFLQHQYKLYVINFSVRDNPNNIFIHASSVENARQRLLNIIDNPDECLDYSGSFTPEFKEILGIGYDFMFESMKNETIECTDFKHLVNNIKIMELTNKPNFVIHTSCLDG